MPYISKLFPDLNLCGICLQILFITANGLRKLVSTQDTSLHIGPIESRDVKYTIP